MMTGSIDLVFRTRTSPSDVGRWFVVDYKSNRLDPHSTGKTPQTHFHFAGMQYEMAHHHYFLQYHIYSLALHRFLSARLGEAYDYDQHFGGVAYLFVRGMTGPEATDPSQEGGRPGVFTDRPPRSVIDALEQVFLGQGDRS
jgi:exodeoxyribonuclease V beta subunit